MSQQLKRMDVHVSAWKRMEAERLRLHEVARREGLHNEGTLRQSKLVDELVVELMRPKDNKEKEGLRK